MAMAIPHFLMATSCLIAHSLFKHESNSHIHLHCRYGVIESFSHLDTLSWIGVCKRLFCNSLYFYYKRESFLALHNLILALLPFHNSSYGAIILLTPTSSVHISHLRRELNVELCKFGKLLEIILLNGYTKIPNDFISSF